MVDHLAPKAAEQRPVGLAQKLKDHAPAGERPAGTGRGAPWLLAPFDEAREVLGDRGEKLALFAEKRPLVRTGELSRVVDLEPSERLTPHGDVDRLAPGSVLEGLRLVDPPAERGPRDAGVGVLPAGGQRGEDLAHRLVDRDAGPRQYLVDPVETRQLLGALLQVVQDTAEGRVAAAIHSASVRRTIPSRVRPSTSTASGAAHRRWRTCSVAAISGCERR